VTIEAPRAFRGVFRSDVSARAVYSEAAGIHRILPAAVAVPVDVEDLVCLVDWARAEGQPLVPRGSGSCMTAASIGPGVIVDLSRWKTIDQRLDDRRVLVGPGVICADVNRAVQGAGLRFPVSPSSAAFCSIGGMTATNAAGAQTLLFGSMRAWVTGIHCVWADGTSEWVRRVAGPPGEARKTQAASGTPHVRKNSSGYDFESHDLVDLLVGSEGTLAFFSQIELALTDRPGGTVTVLAAFDSLDRATDAAIQAADAGAVSCELLDKTFLAFVASTSEQQFSPRTEAVLIAEVEADILPDAESKASSLFDRFHQSGAILCRLAAREAEQQALWTLRHAASPTLARLSEHLKSMQFIEDGCVPPDRLGDYVTGVRAALDRQRIRGVIFGHAGDANVHVNPLIDTREADWKARMDALLDEVTGLVARLGGTISGEHGDGRLRTPLLPRVWSLEAISAFAQVKSEFDPTGILNPGVKTAPAPDSWGIKYDPSLPPHPPSAAAALARVESERAYGEFRLDMLGA
jgi:FAD/FMN-containing dehydrogenase